MQLIWMAGPTDKVVKLSITSRTVMGAVAVLSSLLVLVGFLFHLVGVRVAIEYMPELAYRMGGVTSQAEQEKAEATYRAKLEALNHQLSGVRDRLRELETIKDEVLGRLGIEKLLSFSEQTSGQEVAGRGGPMNWVPSWPFGSEKLNRQLDLSLQQMDLYDAAMANMQTRWKSDLTSLDALPTALPLASEFQLTSSFGIRADPLTHLPSMHDGIDFVAPIGTPVYTTAPGLVLRAEHAGAYGNLVEVEHADGFVTRYAHLRALSVKPHDVLQRHQEVGKLGNTGRSTGPHLHYEVIYKGQAMHPAKALAAWAKS